MKIYWDGSDLWSVSCKSRGMQDDMAPDLIN